MDVTRPLPSYHTRLARAEITLHHQRIPYQVIRSTRARHVRLRMSPADGLTVVVPPGVHPREVPPLLEGKAAWILKQWARIRTALAPRSPGLRPGDLLLYQGRIHRLRVQTRPPGPGSAPGSAAAPPAVPVIRRNQDAIEIWAGPSPTGEELHRHLLTWYRQEARRIIPARTEALAAQLGYRFGRITIRDQKTRWGSCSSRGNLNFNWRLIMTPPAVLDYVIIHELCHLRELNHSPLFWNLVAQACPPYQTHRLWLRQHGPRLTVPYLPPEGPPDM